MEISTEIKAKLDEFYETHKGEMVRDLASLVEIRSVNDTAAEGKPFGEMCAKAVDKGAEILKNHDLSVQNHGYYYLTADAKGTEEEERPYLGILAHLDVVPESDGWHYPPYNLTIQDNNLIGRGTTDDKGPAIAAIYALSAARSIAPLKRSVQIILGSGEEIGSDDIERYTKECKVPKYVFTPDAEFPIINIEKGRYAPEFNAKITTDYSVFDEVPSVRVVSITGGKTSNVVPGKASAILTGANADYDALITILEDTIEKSPKINSLKLTGVKFNISIPEDDPDSGVMVLVEGTGSHAAFPEASVNPQAALIAFLSELPLTKSDNMKQYVDALNELLPFGDTTGKAAGVEMSDELSGALSLAFTVLELLENNLRVIIDIRAPICANKENVKDVIDANFKKRGFDVDEKDMNPPHHADGNTIFVKELLAAYEEVTGQKGSCLAIGGGTYVHHIENGVAFGCSFPGKDYNMHGADEFIPLDELIMASKVFANAIIRLCE